jgi:diguanylate cyclase (GGDEF)-like protein
VLRFAVVTAVGLAIAGAVSLAVLRAIDERQAVRAATERTTFVANTVLRGVVRPTDTAAPVSGSRRRELDRLMRRTMLIDGALRVSLINAGGRITYSTDHRLIGKTLRDPGRLAEVRGGAIVSRVGGVQVVGRTNQAKALVSSVPVRLTDGSVAVVSIEQDYTPIAAAARESFLPVAAVLELSLILLFVLLVPALARASRRLRRYVAQIRHQARHDALTGLSNREALHDDLATALGGLGDGDRAAVLLVDLDRFKEVNDSLGHDAGDELLREIAARLADVADGALVSRLGGDEFAVVVPRTNPHEALAIGHAMRRAIEAPWSIRDIPISVDASIGIALAPEDGSDVSQLIRRADVAMYAAKRARAGVLRYDAATDRNDVGKLALMTELRVAVEREELDIHYQPIVDAHTGMLEKVEALVRWQHPTKGLLAPASFMPLAEHTRLVIGLNRFVLGEAVRQCRIWRGDGIDVGVTVNVTVLDLLERTFASDVAETLRGAAFPASALTIEITEGALVQEPDRARRTLERLRGLGVKIAIDDFGTGYSSLSYLKDLPVDVLKIDRAFINDVPASHTSIAIIAAAIELAHRLDLEVVAEGVETEAQFECLEALGCDLIQGYVVSRPVPAAELTTLLEAARKPASRAA